MERSETETKERDDRMEHTKIFAVAGKGGVGKTSIAAVMVKVLAQRHPDKKILAIDADPAVGLSTALGIDVTMTIDDIRKKVVATVEDGDTKSAMELLGEAKYHIFDAMVETDDFSFIAVGRPESAGCYCKINSYLKEVITLMADNFDYIVIDGEAGIEQINRRVMEKVTHLVLVTDASRKGTQVVRTIKKVADELVMYEKVGVILNRIPDESVRQYMDLGGLKVISCIGADGQLSAFDITGQNVYYLPEESVIVQGVREALDKLEGETV